MQDEELLGRRAVERGLITDEQLKEVLAEAEQLRRSGSSFPLAQLLVKKRYITPQQYVELLKKPEEQSAPRAQIGKYEILREVGRGGMGVVFLARDRDLDRTVALKMLRQFENETAVKRFFREARLIAQLSHPGIIKIFDTGTYRNVPYIVMQYVPGQPLDELMASRKINVRDALGILEQVARAVHFAHTHGVVHRDLKPSNVMVDPHNRAYVMDFGLAKTLDTQSRLTVSGSTVGTPYYMAPEQVRGDAERIGPRTDVYALGVMLYEILTGVLPFTAATEVALFDKILSDDPVPPRSLKTYIERDIEAICLRALEKDPELRYPTAEEFADDLRRFLAAEPIRTLRPSLWRSVTRYLRRHRQRVVAAAFTLLLVGGFGGYLMQREAERRAAEQQHERERRQKLDALIAEAERLVEAEPNRALELLYRVEPQRGDDRVRSLLARAKEAQKRREAAEAFDREIEVIEVALRSNNIAVAIERLRGLEESGRKDPRLEVLKRRARGVGTLTILANDAVEVLIDGVPVGKTPLRDHELEPKLYVVTVKRKPEEVRFPVDMNRGADGSPAAVTIDLGFEWPEGWCFVPAGVFRSGMSRSARMVSDYVILAREVTNREYNEFLEALGDYRRRVSFVPHSMPGGIFDTNSADRPVSGLSFDMAYYYALWRGERLPTSEEFEKAGRGVDGRIYPWGDDPARIDRPEVDVSPYGVRALTTGVAEWTCDLGRNFVFRTSPHGLLRGGYDGAGKDPKNRDGLLLYRLDHVGQAPIGRAGLRLCRSVLPASARTMEQVAAFLSHEAWTLRFEAARRLPEFGEPARNLLRERLAVEPEEAVVFRILHSLRALGVRSVDELPEGRADVYFAAALLGLEGARQRLEAAVRQMKGRLQVEYGSRLLLLGESRGLVHFMRGGLPHLTEDKQTWKSYQNRCSEYAVCFDAVEEMLELMSDPDALVRESAVIAAAGLPYAKTIRKIRDLSTNDPSDRVLELAREEFDYICETWGTMTPEELTGSIRDAPRDAGLIENRGFAYLLTEDWDKALQDAEEALKIEARSRALRIKGFALLRKGRIDDAIRAFGDAAATAIREKQPDAQAWERTLSTVLRAIARYIKGELVEARRDIASAIANAGGDRSDLYYLYSLQGHILAQLGDRQEAAASYRRAFQEWPHRSPIFMYDNVDLFRPAFVWAEYRKLAR